MTALILGIYVLAVARLTRLVNFDAILDRPRMYYAKKVRHRRTWVYFITCPWCVGLWLALAAAVLPVWLLRWPWWAVAPLGLACSHVIGLAAPLASDPEVVVEEAA